MPSVCNQEVRVYFECEGAGPSLVLQHGAGGDINFWQGYDLDKIKNDYRLILIDARGHGKSDKPHEPQAYHYKLMVDDVIAVLNNLNIERTHFWGYSMGGKIGYGLAKHYPGRVYSLVIGGSAPYEVPEQETIKRDAMLQLFEKGLIEGVDVVIEGFRKQGLQISPAYEEHLQSLDLAAVVALARHRASERLDFGDDLSAMMMPCLIYAGDADEPVHSLSEQGAKKLADAAFMSLPGLNHSGAAARSDLILPEVERFLAVVQEKILIDLHQFLAAHRLRELWTSEDD